MSEPHIRYRPDIDGLRAVAVLAIVWYHAFPSRLPGGFVGVDVFFVISGFLISSIILKGIENGTFSYADFYARRIRRIFPALIVVLLATMALGWWILLPDEYRQLGRHVAAGALFASNIQLWSEAGYFEAAAQLKPLIHLWSLGVEEQFYIVWPLCLALIWRLRRGRLALIGVVAGASFLLNLALIERAPGATFYLPVTRLWELLIGALMAAASLRGDLVSAAFGRLSSPWHRYVGATRNVLAGVGATLIAAALVTFDGDLAFPGWFALLPTTGAALIIAAGPEAVLNRRVLSMRLAVFIGLISYPLYLWHWPLLSFLSILGFDNTVFAGMARVGGVALAGLAAFLTYRFWELPLRRRVGVTRVALRLAMGLSVAASCGLIVLYADGVPSRIRSAAQSPAPPVASSAKATPAAEVRPTQDEIPQKRDDSADDSTKVEVPTASGDPDVPAAVPPGSRPVPPAAPSKADVLRAVVDDPACMKKYGLPNLDSTLYCAESDPARAPTVVLMGDSHANALWPGVQDADKSSAVLMIGAGGCVFLRGIRYWRADTPETRSLCPLVTAAAFRAVDEYKPSTIVLTARFAYYTSRNGFGAIDANMRRLHFDSVESPNAKPLVFFRAALLRDLAYLLQADRTVILMLDVPELGFNAENCVKARPIDAFLPSTSECAVSRQLVDERQASYRAVIEGVARQIGSPRLHVVDPMEALCDETQCYGLRDGLLLYRDDNHLLPQGATYVWSRIKPASPAEASRQ